MDDKGKVYINADFNVYHIAFCLLLISQTSFTNIPCKYNKMKFKSEDD